MEFTRELDITPEEFFDQIEKSVQGDIEDATGKAISRAKLNGFKYKKRSRGGGKSSGTAIDVKIKQYRYPEVYEVRFKYSTGSNDITYRATPDGDGGMVLEYTEQYAFAQPVKGLFAQLQAKRYEHRVRRTAEETVKSIVKLAKEYRRARAANPALDRLEDEPDTPAM